MSLRYVSSYAHSQHMNESFPYHDVTVPRLCAASESIQYICTQVHYIIQKHVELLSPIIKRLSFHKCPNHVFTQNLLSGNSPSSPSFPTRTHSHPKHRVRNRFPPRCISPPSWDVRDIFVRMKSTREPLKPAGYPRIPWPCSIRSRLRWLSNRPGNLTRGDVFDVQSCSLTQSVCIVCRRSIGHPSRCATVRKAKLMGLHLVSEGSISRIWSHAHQVTQLFQCQSLIFVYEHEVVGRLRSSFKANVRLQEEILIIRRSEKLIDACSRQRISISPYVSLLWRRRVEPGVMALCNNDRCELQLSLAQLKLVLSLGVSTANGLQFHMTDFLVVTAADTITIVDNLSGQRSCSCLW